MSEVHVVITQNKVTNPQSNFIKRGFPVTLRTTSL